MSDEETVIGRIEPPPVDRRFKVVRLNSVRSYCRHRAQAILDEETRTVTCSDCQAVMDPFTYLLRWSEQEDEWVNREEAAHELEALLVWIISNRGSVRVNGGGILASMPFGGKVVTRRLSSLLGGAVVSLKRVLSDFERQIDWANRSAEARKNAD